MSSLKIPLQWENTWSALGGPMVLPFASTLFGQNRPRDAAYSSLWPPSNHFSSHNLQNQPVKYPGTTPTFELNFLLPITHQPWAPRFIRIIPWRWRPSSTAWLTRTCRSPRPTSLWASVAMATEWLWMAWRTFPTRRSRGLRETLRNAKPAPQPCPLPGRAEAISRWAL